MASISLENFVKQFDQQNSPVLRTNYSNVERAVLYIFTPRMVPDVTVRPYMYHFSPALTQKMADMVTDAVRISDSSYGGNFTMQSRLPGDPEADRAVAPAATGPLFSGRHFNDHHTGILVVDNAQFEGRALASGDNNRLVYSGVFLDEPYVNTPTGLVLNPRCPFVVTNVAHMGVKSIYGPGGESVHASVREVSDIVPVTISQRVSPERNYLMRPADLFSGSTLQDESGVMYDIPERTALSSQTHNVRINTALNTPREHISRIFMGVANNAVKQHQVANYPLHIGTNPTFVDDSITAQNINSGMADSSPYRTTGLQLNDLLTIQDLVIKYPGLPDSTQIIQVPYDLPESPMDDRGPTPTNVWTALLMNTIPPVMAMFGISDAIFRYDSYTEGAMSVFDNHPNWERMLMDTFIPMESAERQNSRWLQALKYLEDYVFPIIITHAGNFTALVKYSHAKECVVNLNLVDFTDVVNPGMTVNNTLFSGFQTPMVGTLEAATSNRNEIQDTVATLNAYADSVTRVVY